MMKHSVRNSRLLPIGYDAGYVRRLTMNVSFIVSRYAGFDTGFNNVKPASNLIIPLFILLAVCIFGRSSEAQTSIYVFDPNQSTILQTGGIAGINRTYTVEGQFQLTVDFDAGTAFFDKVDANAVDDSQYKRTLDPNEVFAMTSLVGIVTGDTGLEFAGYSADGSSILLEITIVDDIITMKAQTTPPPNSADFFIFTMDAVAQRKYGGGTGEPNNPYQITTAEDLMLLGETPEDYDKHFILTADIDLDPNLPNGKVFTNALIASDPRYPYRFNTDTLFTGSFNGNGFSINNLVINSSDDHIGIFGFIGTGGIVENLKVENVKIYSTKHNVGGLAGENWGTIRNCHVTGNLYGHSKVGGLVGTNGSEIAPRTSTDTLSSNILINEQIEGIILSCSTNVEVTGTMINTGGGDSSSIGGLVGGNAGGIIRLCKSSGNINGDYNTGGLVGGNSGRIDNCYSDCHVQGINSAGGLIGRNTNSVMLCYSTGMVTGEKYVGGLIGSNEGVAYLSYWDIQTSGLNVSKGGRGKSTQQMKNIQTFRGWGYEDIWTIEDGNDYPRLAWEEIPGGIIVDAQSDYAGGTGDVNDPYQIRTAEQLLAIGYCWSDFNDSFILMEDIDFNDIDPNVAVSIGIPAFPYSGIFDGNNNTISNFKCWNALENYVGIFGNIGQLGNVKNISISNADVQGYRNTGILAGRNEGLIKNCNTSGHVVGYDYVGGLAGYNKDNAIINLCSSDVDIKGTNRVGGLVGRNQDATISMCDSFVIVITGGEGAGGLVGTNAGYISSCYSHGWISGDHSVGGLVGMNSYYTSGLHDGNIFDSYSATIVEGEKDIGGLIGDNWGCVYRCYSTGTIRGIENTGGLIGSRYTAGGLYPASAEDCYWDIETSGQIDSAGGTGKTTDEMQTENTFTDAGWDFIGETVNGTDDIWWILEGQDYPRLWWEMTEDDINDPNEN